VSERALVLSDGQTRLILDETEGGGLTILLVHGKTANDFYISPRHLSNAQGLANFLVSYLKEHENTL